MILTYLKYNLETKSWRRTLPVLGKMWVLVSQSLIGREWQENGISFARLCETKDITVLLWSKMPEKHRKWTLDSC